MGMRHELKTELKISISANRKIVAEAEGGIAVGGKIVISFRNR